MNAKIRPIKKSELSLLKDMAPPEWNIDFSTRFGFHFRANYFHLLVAEVDGQIAGCANGLLHGFVGWLGNIVVRPAFRGQGIGTALTGGLVNFFASRGVTSQILIATPLGEPVYKKFGFTTRSSYIFLRNEQPPPPEIAAGLRPARPEDAAHILALDLAVTGEPRQDFLTRFLEYAWVHARPAGGIAGFFLPELEAGPVIATDQAAGLALLRFKLGLGSTHLVIPSSNQAAQDYLAEAGYMPYNTAPRMVLGPEVEWHPELVFSRGGGYCG
ncbi:MAG: GNAT family N-acetyltransferase [Anaerolineales bacterium]|nr:GNAT family N-acetyltransferase [Anaerolineales bacterium]